VSDLGNLVPLTSMVIALLSFLLTAVALYTKAGADRLVRVEDQLADIREKHAECERLRAADQRTFNQREGMWIKERIELYRRLAHIEKTVFEEEVNDV